MRTMPLISAVLLSILSGPAYSQVGDWYDSVNRESFEYYDYDGDGSLAVDEYGMYATSETGMNAEQAANYFNALDADGSGSLSFNEFNGGYCCT